MCPELLGQDKRALDRCHCYGQSIENGLLFIQSHGIPKECVEIFDCADHEASTVNEPFMKMRKIKAVRRIESLEEALKQVRRQPIGADVLHYSGLFESGEHVYEGPMTPTSRCLGYHALIIDGVEERDGDIVAVCKMSNGENAGDEGYAYVSLTTRCFPVGLSAKSKRFIRPYDRPMSLLTNFVYPEMEGEIKYKRRREEKHTREAVKEKICQEIQYPMKTRDVV